MAKEGLRLGLKHYAILNAIRLILLQKYEENGRTFQNTFHRSLYKFKKV